MSGLFHWSMRNAAALLFAAALLIVLAGLFPIVQELIRSFSRRASSLSSTEQADWMTIYSMVFASIGGAVWPLFGAGLLYRMDRLRGLAAPSNPEMAE